MNNDNFYPVLTTVRRVAFFFLLMLAAPLTFASGGSVPFDASSIPQVEDVDFLAIDSRVKEIVDRTVSDIPDKKERARALHILLFNNAYLGITYGDFQTQTAQQTFDTRVGNCISLASLYVAAARYAGLDAKFQTVDVPRDWIEEESFYIVPSHINVAVSTSRFSRELIVEFTDTYSAKDTRLYPSKAISDRRVLAEYYNNIGMEYMRQSKNELAFAYLRKSTQVYPRVGFVWSNLGVIYKTFGLLDEAERSYEKGLRLERKNLSIINNLYVLYRQTGKDKEAAKLARKVESYSRKNPYYLAKLASSEVRLGNTTAAINLLKKAIKVNGTEQRFHLALASAYFLSKDYENSIEQVKIARKLSAEGEDQARFQKKIAYIQTYDNASGSSAVY